MKILEKDPTNLLVGGVGGQGNVIMSQFIGRALVNQGYFASVGDTFGASQRGGSVASHVRISKATQYSSLIPAGHADVILSLEPAECIRTLGVYGNPETAVITNSRPVYPPGDATYPDMDYLLNAIKKLSAKLKIVDATGEALKMGSSIFTNVILLGALIGLDLLPLDKESMVVVLAERFHGAVLDSNIKALDKGIELVKQ